MCRHQSHVLARLKEALRDCEKHDSEQNTVPSVVPRISLDWLGIVRWHQEQSFSVKRNKLDLQ